LADTPACEEGERIWDDRVGSVVMQNHNLKKAIAMLLVINLVLGGGLVWQSTRLSLVPYVIEVNTDTGLVKAVGELKGNTNYTPQEAEKKYFLSQFITNTREIPLDPVVFKEHWRKAYGFLTQMAATKMNAEMQNEKTAEKFGRETVQVNIISILPIEGSNSYQVKWEEEEFLIGSGEKTIVPMSGIFTVTIIPPEDEKMLFTNPLGMYISDFNWAKDATAINAKKK
jgi:type IV secretion system protein VirB5